MRDHSTQNYIRRLHIQLLNIQRCSESTILSHEKTISFKIQKITDVCFE